jgi:hypothetical protein
MEGKVKFILYLEQILGAVVPTSKRSKVILYQIRSQLVKEPRFAGKALLLKVIDQASDYL